jgi:alcohol dehydrogenase
VDWLFAMNEELGIPKLKNLKGVRPEDFETIAEVCVAHSCAEANPRPVGAEAFLGILRAAHAR